MSAVPVSMACAGCGAFVAPDEPYPFRCPSAGAGDDVDHVLARTLDPGAVRFPDPGDDEPNPFVRYRRLFRAYHVARSHGMTDDHYVDLVRRLDKEVAGVDGLGFEVTPLEPAGGLAARLGFEAGGTVWVKDETGNVSGSHKARHLMGLLIHLELAERLGLAGDAGDRDLAIASCGNAALAAAVVARAGDRTLQVFVPTWGDRWVIDRLRDLRATVNVVERQAGVAGDPTVEAMQRAVAAGALPFTCQGTENGLVVEGGHTLAWEIASQAAAAGARLDRIFVQVGGGALASAVVQGLREAVDLGAMERMPRIHAVQTEGGAPLRRAYDRVMDRAVDALGLTRKVAGAGDRRRADLVAGRRSSPEVGAAVQHAARNRSQYMWPWETEPKSVAHGILDDETYDWLAVVRGMLETGGWPVVVSEDDLIAANDAARETTAIAVDHTGSSGLAGLVRLRRDDEVHADESVAVLFTGATRGREEQG